MDTDDDQMQLSESSAEESPTRISNEDKDNFGIGSKAQILPHRATINENYTEMVSTLTNSPMPELQKLPSPDPSIQSGNHQSNDGPESCDVPEVVTMKSPIDLPIPNSTEKEFSITSDVSTKTVPEGKLASHSGDEEEVSIAASNTSDISDAKETTTSETNKDVPETISANTFSANPPTPSISVADDLAPELRASKEPESVPIVGSRQRWYRYANDS